MRLNLGCGHSHMEGFVNCDKEPSFNPDRIVDLEALPWPFEDNSAEEIILSHVLEHVGQSSEIYLGIIRELYRIAAPGAEIRITVPHPRHDDFLTDPTHVRPILPEQFYMFSKKTNAEWRDGGYANTPLADILDVDFEVADIQWVPDDKWVSRLQAGEVSSAELADMAQHQFNILKEARITLKVLK